MTSQPAAYCRPLQDSLAPSQVARAHRVKAKQEELDFLKESLAMVSLLELPKIYHLCSEQQQNKMGACISGHGCAEPGFQHAAAEEGGGACSGSRVWATPGRAAPGLLRLCHCIPGYLTMYPGHKA